MMAEDSLDISFYIKHVRQRLDDETIRFVATSYGSFNALISFRVRRYLDETRTRRALIASVEKHLIGTHIQTIINRGSFENGVFFAEKCSICTGLHGMLNKDAHDDISLMFELVSTVQNGRAQFKNAFSDYIKRNGKVIVMNTEREKTMVVDLLAFRRRLDTIVAKLVGL